MVPNPRKVRSKKRRVTVSSNGFAYIKASFNNMIITLTNQQRDTVASSSSGACGFRGAKKSTPFAFKQIAKRAVEKAYAHGLRTVAVLVNGAVSGREHAIRTLQEEGLEVTEIRDITPLPHNGCRPPKRRRT